MLRIRNLCYNSHLIQAFNCINVFVFWQGLYVFYFCLRHTVSPASCMTSSGSKSKKHLTSFCLSWGRGCTTLMGLCLHWEIVKDRGISWYQQTPSATSLFRTSLEILHRQCFSPRAGASDMIKNLAPLLEVSCVCGYYFFCFNISNMSSLASESEGELP